MRHAPLTLASLAFLALSAGPTLAQDAAPADQPTMLDIFMEEVKMGHEAAHQANEKGWPAAFARAGAPEIYLALESITGPQLVWYVQPFENWTAQGRAMSRNEADPVLSAELARLWREDAQHLVSSRRVQAMGRPDLSYGAFPDIARDRFWDITVFRTKPGYAPEFEGVVTAWIEKASSQGSDASFRMYQVTAGWPGGTYLLFSSVADYGEFDAAMATSNAVWESMSEGEMQDMFDDIKSSVASSMLHRFRLNPSMSYVGDDVRAVDPEFWNRP